MRGLDYQLLLLLRLSLKDFGWLQAQAQSQAQAASRDRGDVARSPQDAAEAWRRHIYVEGLYAQPMGVFPTQYFSEIITCMLENLSMQRTLLASS